MKKTSLHTLLLLAIILVYSCNNNTTSKSIVGKWKAKLNDSVTTVLEFTSYNGDIDGQSNKLNPFSHETKTFDDKNITKINRDIPKFWNLISSGRLHWKLQSGTNVLDGVSGVFSDIGGVFKDIGVAAYNIYVRGTGQIFDGTIVLARRDPKTGKILSPEEYCGKYPDDCKLY